RFGLAVMAYSQPWSVGAVDGTIVTLTKEALERISQEDSAMRARLLSRLGRELYFGQLEESDRLREEGIEVARRVGDKRTLVEVLYNKWFGATSLLQGAEERRVEVIEVIGLAQELNDLAMVGSERFAGNRRDWPRWRLESSALCKCTPPSQRGERRWPFITERAACSTKREPSSRSWRLTTSQSFRGMATGQLLWRCWAKLRPFS